MLFFFRFAVALKDGHANYIALYDMDTEVLGDQFLREPSHLLTVLAPYCPSSSVLAGVVLGFPVMT